MIMTICVGTRKIERERECKSHITMLCIGLFNERST